MKAEETEKKLSVKQYLNKITLRLYNLINDHKIVKKSREDSNICACNFTSSKDTGETRTIYVWSNNAKIMWGSDTYDIIT